MFACIFCSDVFMSTESCLVASFSVGSYGALHPWALCITHDRYQGLV